MTPLFSDWQWGAMSVHAVVSVKTRRSSRVIHNRGNTQSYQLGIKFTGESELRYKGTRIDFSAGTVAFLPKEETEQIDYTTLTVEEGSGVCIFFDSTLPLAKEPQVLHSVDHEIEMAFLKVLQRYQRPDRYTAPEVMEAFYALLSKLVRASQPGDQQNSVRRFEPALSYMQRHLADEYIDLKRAAALCSMSEKNFRNSFKKAFFLSPLQYFHQQKASYICSLLADLSLSVSEVSRMSGFSDSNYFSRFFRKHMGVSPTEYRMFYCKRL